MGKYVLFVVLGVSFYFVVMSRNMSRNSTDAYANYLFYNARTNSHNIAVSAANMLANWVFLDTTNGTIAYSNMNFNGGSYSAYVTDIVGTNRKLISVYSQFAVNLPKSITKKYNPRDTSIIRDTCVVILQPSGYSKYAYYSVLENNINWISKDTIWGPFHTQDDILVPSGNSPVYYGRVTTNKGKTGSGTPKFLGGYESGVNIPLNAKSLLPIKQAALDNGRYFYHDSLRLIFKDDSVTWHFGKNKDSTMLISEFTPNGVIVCDSNIIRLSGRSHGRVTIASLVISGKTNMGEIWLDDDFKYTDDPRTVPGARNISGLVATNEIYITDNTPNRSDIVVQAACFSLNYGFGAYKYDTRPVSGMIYLLGGIVQKNRLAVGTFSGTTIKTGFGKSYRYDTRLYTDAPPFYPTTGLYEIISWRE